MESSGPTAATAGTTTNGEPTPTATDTTSTTQNAAGDAASAKAPGSAETVEPKAAGRVS